MADFTLQTQLEIDGQPLDDELVALLEEIVFDDALSIPDMVAVRFRDVERRVLADAKVRIGSILKLSATAVGGASPEVLLVADVTSIEAEYSATGSRAVIRGYDPSHRLHRGRRTESYVGMKDSDIAQAIAARHRIEQVQIEDSGPVLQHVSQANETDWVFLLRRAREIGFELGVDRGVFFFRPPAASTEAPEGGDYDSEDPLQLVMGQDLLRFQPRVSSSEQVGEVIVRGWDPMAKEAVVGRAAAQGSSASLRTSPTELASLFGEPVYTCVDRPLSTQAAVDATAKAISERIGSAFAEAEGVARGNPRLKAGTPVSISVVADDFAGKYVITQSTHVFDRDGYRTMFAASGRLDRSLLALASGNGGGTAAEPITGVVVGIVTNNDDPDALGRVKLKFPWLADDYESDWARLVQLGAGPDSGAVFIPEVNDEVLVAFEFGDVRRPYVVGSLWNGVDKPNLVETPGHAGSLFDNGGIRRRGFVSRRGHRAVFLDADGESGIDLVTSDDRLRITLDESGTEIKVTSDGTIVIESQRDISITSGANIKIEASGNLELKGGGNTKVEGGATVDIDGGLITLN